MKIFKKIFIAALFFLSNFFSYAFSLTFSQTYFTKLQYGKLGEYVYEQKDSSSPYVKLSYLDWPKKNIFNTGTKFSAKTKSLSLDAALSFALSNQNTVMRDYDYLNHDDTLICYSESKNKLEQNIFYEVNLSYSFFLKNFTISANTGLTFNDIYFSAKDGYGWYGNTSSPYVAYDDSAATYYNKLCGISYQRQTLCIWLGLKAELELKKINFSLFYGISPFTYIYSIDKHFTDISSTYFTLYNDRQTGIFSWHKIGFGTEIFLKKCSLLFNVTSVFGKTSLGKSYIGNSNIYSSQITVLEASSKCMADELSFNAELALKFIL